MILLDGVSGRHGHLANQDVTRTVFLVFLMNGLRPLTASSLPCKPEVGNLSEKRSRNAVFAVSEAVDEERNRMCNYLEK